MTTEEFASSAEESSVLDVYMEDPFDDPLGTEVPEISSIKYELLELASDTKRGFSATRQQKQAARELCDRLKKMNPASEPLYPFYSNNNKKKKIGPDDGLSLVGKWTLVYTDVS